MKFGGRGIQFNAEHEVSDSDHAFLPRGGSTGTGTALEGLKRAQQVLICKVSSARNHIYSASGVLALQGTRARAVEVLCLLTIS